MAATPRLVTPEAVVLQFETAGLGSRLLAAFLDLLAQAAILLGALLALGALGGAGDVGATAAGVLLLLVITTVLFGYPIAFETLWRGRTPGKAALGLRVVTREGAPERFRHAVVRGFLGLVDFWLTSGAGAVLTILLTRDNQRLGDLAAGTLVLRERSGAGRVQAVRFPVPAGYEGYAATLDVSGLGGAGYGAVRSFLLRATTLPPAVRATLATEVATTVAAGMRHTPPPGISPEAFLACVAAAYQRRADSLVPPSQAWAPAADVWAGPAAATAPPAPPAPAPAAGGVLPPPG